MNTMRSMVRDLKIMSLECIDECGELPDMWQLEEFFKKKYGMSKTETIEFIKQMISL